MKLAGAVACLPAGRDSKLARSLSQIKIYSRRTPESFTKNKIRAEWFLNLTPQKSKPPPAAENLILAERASLDSNHCRDSRGILQKSPEGT